MLGGPEKHFGARATRVQALARACFCKWSPIFRSFFEEMAISGVVEGPEHAKSNGEQNTSWRTHSLKKSARARVISEIATKPILRIPKSVFSPKSLITRACDRNFGYLALV